MKANFLSLVITFTFCFISIHAMGQKTWIGGNSLNSWADASNWSPTGVPGPTDDVVFNASSVNNCNIIGLTINVNSITIDATFTNSISQSSSAVTVASDFIQHGGNYGLNSIVFNNSFIVNGNFTLTGGTFSGGFTDVNTVTIANTMTISGGTFEQNVSPISTTDFIQNGGVFDGGNRDIAVNGNFELENTSTFTSTSSTLTIQDAFNVLNPDPTFNHNSGTVEFVGSGTSTVLSFIDLDFNNVVSAKTTSSGLLLFLPLTSQFINIEGDLSINNGRVSGGASMNGNTSAVSISSSFPDVWLSGGRLRFRGDGSPSTQSLVITGTNYGCIDAEIIINGDLVVNFNSDVIADNSNIRLENGAIHTTNLLTIGDGVFILTQPGNTEDYIQGRIRKIGQTPFTFPVGHSSLPASQRYQPISISDPGTNPTDAFTAEFIPSAPSNPNTFATQAGIGNQLVKVFGTGYWSLERTSGTATPDVRLSWNGNLTIPSGAGLTSNLVVAGWNGTAWENHGQTNFSGDETTGEITNASSAVAPITSISNYQLFAVGLSDTGVRYWVGKNSSAPYHWDDPDNWSVVSGGDGGFAAPTSVNQVIFDGIDAQADNPCTINTNVNITEWDITAGYSGTITQGGATTINVGNGGYAQAGGTFVGSGASFTTGGGTSGNFEVTGGIFTLSNGTFITNYAATVSGTSDLTLTSGNWFAKGNTTISNTGIYSTNNGIVIFDGNVEQDVTAPSFHNVEVNKTGSGLDDDINFTGTLVINGDLVLTDGVWDDGNIDLKGNLTVGANALTAASAASLTLSGAGDQTISSNRADWLAKSLNINKPAGDVILAGTHPLLLDNSNLTLAATNSANIRTSASNLLVIDDNVTVILEAGNTGFVDGPMQKIGDDPFLFPIGDASGATADHGYHPISIGNDGANINTFTASYTVGTPTDASNMAPGASPVVSIHQDSYWTLTRNAGSSNVPVTLGWSGSNFPLASLSDVAVAGYSASGWVNHGRTGVTGTTTAGTVTSNNTPVAIALATATPYQFALGYVDSGNRYWRTAAVDNNWDNPNNWSLTSAAGSSVGATVPNNTHDVFFTGGNVACNLSSNVNIKGLTINGYAGTITQGTNDITIGVTGFTQSTGTFSGGDNPITLNGDFTLNSGGTFTKTTGDPVRFNEDILLNGGNFSVLDIEVYKDFTVAGTFTGTNFIHTGTFTSVGSDASTVSINTTSLSFNHVIIQKNDGVNFNLAGTQQAIVNGGFAIADGIWNNGSLRVQGSVTLATNMDATGSTGSLTFQGGNPQTITATNGTAFNKNIVLNKSANDVTLSGNLILDQNGQTVTFISGDIVTSAGNLLSLEANTSVSGASNSSHVNGPMRKTGATSFSFPVGDGTTLQQITIAPSGSATYQAAFDDTDLFVDAATSLSAPLSGLYTNGNPSWQISKISGADAAITLPWMSAFCSPGTTIFGGLSDVVIARYNTGSSRWENVTPAATHTGNVTSSGTVTSSLTSIPSVVENYAVASIADLQHYHWLGTTNANWNELNNWSYSSGGCEGVASLPDNNDLIIFDGGGNNPLNLTQNIDVLGVDIESTFTSTINFSTFDVTVGTDDFTQAGGTVNGGSGTVTFADDFTIAGGTFNATSGTTNLTGDLNYNGGTFNHSNGTLELNGSADQTLNLTAGALTLYNFIINNSGTGTDNEIRINSNLLQANNDVQINDGHWVSGDIHLRNDFSIGASASDGQGSNATLTFNGNASQNINLTGGIDKLDASIVVDKAGGILDTSSSLTLDGTNQDFTINNGTFELENTHQFQLGGNLIVNGGTFRFDGATTTTSLTFIGNGNQTVQGAGTSVRAYNLNINKTGGTLTIERDVEVSNNMAFTGGDVTLDGGNLHIDGTLDMTDGNITLTSGNILLGLNGTLANESNSNRIQGSGGYVEATPNFTTSGAKTDIAGLGISITSTNILGATTIRRGHEAQIGENPENHPSIFRYFDIEPTNNTGLNASLSFEYFDGELNSQSETDFVLWSSDLPTVSNLWMKENSSLNTGTNTLEVSGVNEIKDRWTISNLTTNFLNKIPPEIDIDGDASYVLNETFSISSIFGATTKIVDDNVTIADADNPEIERITITLNAPAPVESLSISGTLPASITATPYNSGTGVLVLNGTPTASLSDFTDALKLIRYSGDATLTGSVREITFVAHDGTFDSQNNVKTEVTVSTGIGAGFANYLQFDGANDYVNIPTAPFAGLTSGTIEMWVRTSTDITSLQTILGAASATSSLRIFIQSGTFRYDIGGTIATSTAIATSTWYHLAIVHDGTNTEIYINGNAQGTATNPGFFSSVTGGINTLTLGAFNNGTPSQYFNGAIDEVRIWNTNRSGDIQAFQYSQVPESNPDLVAYWTFDREILAVTCPQVIDNKGVAHGELLPNPATSDAPQYASAILIPNSATAITDQRNVPVGTPYSFTFNTNAFSASEPTVTYRAFLINGGTETELPTGWLSFNATTRTLSGTPTIVGEYRVRIQAEQAGTEASDVFSIVVGAPNIEVRQTAPSAITFSSSDDLDFGNVQTADPANATHTLQIRNAGNLPLNFTGGCPNTIAESITITGTNASDFSFSPSPLIGSSTLAPSANYGFDIIFNPSGPGLRNATLTIVTDDPDTGTFTLNLRGNGIEPEINLRGSDGVATPQNITNFTTPTTAEYTDLGDVLVSGSRTFTFTIENVATGVTAGDLEITLPSFSAGNGENEFSIDATSTSTPINNGSSTTFTITFTPINNGAETATVSIPNNDADEGSITFVVGARGVTAPIIDLDVSAGGNDFTANSFEGNTVNIVDVSDLSITDPDNTTLTGIQIQLNSPQVGESISANPSLPAGITGSYNSTTGEFNLSGTASISDYITALERLEYNGFPGLLPAFSTRTITFQANDGTFDGNIATTTINITEIISAGFGQGLSFDGDDYVNFSEHASGFASHGQGTIEAWIKVPTSATNTHVIFAASDSTRAGDELRLMVEDNKLTYRLRNNNESNDDVTKYHSDVIINDDNWHHVAITHTSGGDTRMYVDGALQTTEESRDQGFFGNITVGINHIALGRNVDTSNPEGEWFFNGIIDEVRIWSVVKTAAQISEGSRTQLLGNEPNLLAYWNFDEEGTCYQVLDFAGTRHGFIGTTGATLPQFVNTNGPTNGISEGIAIPHKPSLATIGAPFSYTPNLSNAFEGSLGASYTVAYLGAPSAWLTFNPTTGELSSAAGPSPTDAGILKVAITGTVSGFTATDVFTLEVGEPAIELTATATPTELINDNTPGPSNSPSITNSTSFGNVGIGVTQSFTYTIRNTGSRTLILSGTGCSPSTPPAESFKLSGPQATDFTINLAGTVPSLAPNSTTTFEVSFTPTANGTREATLTFESNIGTFEFSLAGIGTNPGINVEASNGAAIANASSTPSTTNLTDFGNVVTGSIEYAYRIVNTGSVPLNLTGTPNLVLITGTHATDFSVTQQPTSPIIGGGDSEFRIQFTPGGLGERFATVTIPNDDPGENPYVFNIKGQGAFIDIDVAGNSLPIVSGATTTSTENYTNFGVVGVLSGTQDRAFNIQNSGSGSLVISSINITPNVGTNAGEFTTPSLATTIPPGGNTSFIVTFNPDAVGTRSAIVTITSNDPDEGSFNFTIEGTGANPEIMVRGDGNDIVNGSTTPTATNLTNFGSALITGGSVIRSFQIVNTGNAKFSLTNTPPNFVTISGPDAGEFSVIAQPNDDEILGGGSENFLIQFSPTSAGVKNATIEIANDVNTNYTFAIQGNGSDVAQPDISVEKSGTAIPEGSPAPISSSPLFFGFADVAGGSITKTYTIKNTGTADLNLTGAPIIEIGGTHASDFSVGAPPTTPIPSGGSSTFTIVFDPSASDIRQASIRIASNDSNVPLYIFGIAGFGGVDPTPADDIVSVLEETPTDIDILANDTDPNGETLIITNVSIITPPSSGVAAVDVSGGVIRYTPQIDFNGSDAITYQVCNSLGLCATATINITVSPDSDAPVAVNDSYEIPAGETALLNVQQNDVDPDNTGLNTIIITLPENGSAVVQSGKAILYTPSSGFTGEDRLTYEVCNGASLCDQASVIINVFDGLIARNDEVSIQEDEIKEIFVLGNDEDPAGNPLRVSINRLPSHGDIRITSAQTIVYIPEAEFFGETTFSYQICNPDNKCDTATVFIQISEINDSPVVASERVELPEDSSISVEPLQNDADPEGETLTLRILQQPAHGSVIRSNNLFTYTPDADFFGVDTLYYEVCDPQQACSQTFIVFNVTPVNDPPIAVDDVVEIDELFEVIDVLANDIETDGEPLTITILEHPSSGIASVNGNIILYLPRGNTSEGTYTLRYQICDTTNLCSEAVVTLNVTPFNEPPATQNLEVITTEETPIEINLLAVSIDPEGAGLSLSLTLGATNGITLLAGGVLTYTPLEGFTGVETLFYTACDPANACSTSSIKINVNPSDGSPVAINDIVENAFAGNPINIDVLANDFDPTDDPLQVSLVSNPLHGEIQSINGGIITYLPQAGYIGNDSLRYQICDPTNLCDTALVRIKVNPITAAPIAQNDEVIINEDEEVVIDVQANDSDPDMDILVTSLVRSPSHGRFTILNNDSILYQPNENFAGFDVFTYQVCDPSNQCATATVQVQVNPVNDAPFANDDFEFTTQGTQFSFNPRINDSDPENDPLTLSIIADPSEGFAFITSDGRISYDPDDTFIGVDEIQYRICDTGGLCASATVFITVSPLTGPPIAQNDRVSTDEDTPSLAFFPLNNDRDPDGENMTASIIEQPQNGIIEAAGVNRFIYIPNENHFGNDQASYQVCDIQGDCDTASIFFTIKPVNDAPIAVDDIFNADDRTDIFLPLDNDIDPDQEKSLLRFTVLENENGRLGNLGNVKVSGQIIAYNPFTGAEGVDLLTYVICDSENLCDTAQIRINVSIPLNPPIASSDSLTADVDEALEIVGRNLLLNDFDEDDNLDSLSIEIALPPTSGGTAFIRQGEVIVNGSPVTTILIDYTPSPFFTGIDRFDYRVCDLTGLCDTASVYIEVQEFLVDNLEIYSGFSPDGDGINDQWVIFGLQYFENNKVKIMNRWGTVIYEAEQYDNIERVWDGRFQKNAGLGNDIVPEGTYFYEIDLGNGQKPKRGFVEVKRR